VLAKAAQQSAEVGLVAIGGVRLKNADAIRARRTATLPIAVRNFRRLIRSPLVRGCASAPIIAFAREQNLV